VWVSIRFFLLSPLQCTLTHCRNCKRLREYEEILRLLSGFRPRIRPLDIYTVVPLLTEIVILVVLADEGGGGLRANSSDSKDSGLSYLGFSDKMLIKGSLND
jgi:hypothetical protein